MALSSSSRMACTVMRNVSQIYKAHAGPAMDDSALFLNHTQQAGHRSPECFSCELATLVSDKGEERLVSWCVCFTYAESMATKVDAPKFDLPSQHTNPTPRGAPLVQTMLMPWHLYKDRRICSHNSSSSSSCSFFTSVPPKFSALV